MEDIFEQGESIDLEDVEINDGESADSIFEDEQDGAAAAEATAEADAAREVEPPETQQEKPEENAQETGIEITFNHQTKVLPKKEAEAIASALGVDVDTFRTTYQKGMRGDVVDGKLADLEKKIENAARGIGTDRSGVIKMLDTAADRALISRIANDVKAQNPDYSDQAVQEIAQLRLAQEKQRESAEKAQREQESVQSRQQPLVEFFMRHPEFDDKNIPREILDDFAAGNGSLEEALLRYQVKQKDAEIAQIKQQQENKKRAIGSVTSETDAAADADPFLSGFLGAD